MARLAAACGADVQRPLLSARFQLVGSGRLRACQLFYFSGRMLPIPYQPLGFFFVASKFLAPGLERSLPPGLECLLDIGLGTLAHSLKSGEEVGIEYLSRRGLVWTTFEEYAF